MNAILENENPNEKMRIEENADDLIEQKRQELQDQIEEANKALKRRETQLAQQLQVRMGPEERKEQKCENIFKRRYEDFKATKFTIDDIWERRELRFKK